MSTGNFFEQHQFAERNHGIPWFSYTEAGEILHLCRRNVGISRSLRRGVSSKKEYKVPTLCGASSTKRWNTMGGKWGQVYSISVTFCSHLMVRWNFSKVKIKNILRFELLLLIDAAWKVHCVRLASFTNFLFQSRSCIQNRKSCSPTTVTNQ